MGTSAVLTAHLVSDLPLLTLALCPISVLITHAMSVMAQKTYNMKDDTNITCFLPCLIDGYDIDMSCICQIIIMLLTLVKSCIRLDEN